MNLRIFCLWFSLALFVAIVLYCISNLSCASNAFIVRWKQEKRLDAVLSICHDGRQYIFSKIHFLQFFSLCSLKLIHSLNAFMLIFQKCVYYKIVSFDEQILCECIHWVIRNCCTWYHFNFYQLLSCLYYYSLDHNVIKHKNASHWQKHIHKIHFNEKRIWFICHHFVVVFIFICLQDWKSTQW